MNPINPALLRVADALSKSAPELNALDAVAGDGDLGVTAARVARVIRDHVALNEEQSAPGSLAVLAAVLEQEAPSSCGTLLASALLTAATSSVVVSAETSEEALATGMHQVIESIKSLGGAEIGQRTMLDALVPAAQSFALHAFEGLNAALPPAAAAADQGAKATAQMTPQFGRAAWTPDRALGHEDAGARLVAVVLAAVAGASSA